MKIIKIIKKLFNRLNQSRFDIKEEWTPELIELVKQKMADFDFLKSYSFKE